MRALVAGLLVVVGCASPGTLRQTPPPALDTSAAAISAPAPTLDLAAATGERWSLTAARHRPALLVFYRGHW